jgi:hypothetical protein
VTASVAHINFDVIVSRESERYRARVVDSPSGSGSVEFSPPFLSVELENMSLRVSRFGQTGRRTRIPQVDSARDIGGRLFDAVFAGAVRDCYRASLAEATSKGQGLRLRLRLTDVPEIAIWPWEFLFDSSQNRFIALSRETPLVRYLDFAERVEILEVAPPLRVLLVVSSPTDYAQLDVERECGKMDEAVAELKKAGRLSVDRIDKATLGELQRALTRQTYHILHFIGHGGADGASEGHLMFEDNDQRGYAIDGSTLGTLLHNHPSMRIALLNACEGARTLGKDSFAGVAQRLVQQGVPCVVAMQFEISDASAIQFSTAFYEAVATNQPVDQAVAQGRLAIYSEVSDLEWATPVLYLRSPDARIFAPSSRLGIVPPQLVPPKPATTTAEKVAEPATKTTTEQTKSATDTATIETTQSKTTAFAAVTLASIFLGAGMALWAVAHLTFNLVSFSTASETIQNVAPLASIAAALISGVAYVLTGNGSSLIARVGRWLALGADGKPRLDRLGIGFAVAVLSVIAVMMTPTLRAEEVPGDVDQLTGWTPINVTAEGIPESVYREASWYIGPGHASDVLQLEVRIEPFDSVMFGRVLAPAGWLNDAVQVPRPGNRSPMLVKGLSASWPGQRGRLRFRIVRDSAMQDEEIPQYVQVDTRIVDQAGKVLAQQCRRLPARWTTAPVDAGSDQCPPIR